MDRIGRYKIVRELGRGAMGVVYHAIDPNIGRPVAIKTIQLGSARKPEEQERLRERLFREARSAGMLSHPGIVTIYDVEQQGDVAYIAMEYVDGPTLDDVLSGRTPSPREAVQRPRPDRRRPRLCPQQGHHPPRHQARQHHDCRATARSKSPTSESPKSPRPSSSR